MIESKPSTILSQTILILIGIVTCFFNYCIFQLIKMPIIPLTIIPIAIYAIKYNHIPIYAIFIISICDDIMLNSFLGIHLAIYLILSHTANLIAENSKKTNFIIFSIIYILINSILIIASIK